MPLGTADFAIAMALVVILIGLTFIISRRTKVGATAFFAAAVVLLILTNS